MKRSILFLLFVLFLFPSCLIDQYAIKDGKREPLFIPQFYNNYKGHLFWYTQKDLKGKNLKDEKGKPVIFDKEKETIIFVHGWQGVGIYGWTTHSIMTGPSFFFGPLAILVSWMYNIPTGGAGIPDFKNQLNKYNVATYDWQKFNNIAENYETSQNLSELESNIKKNPVDWINIPEQLRDEIKIMVDNTKYDKKIILVAHSIGTQVTLRAYNMLEPEYKNRISKIFFLDPFTTNHFDYMNEKVGGDNHWMTGNTSKWIKEDITNLLDDDVKSKLTVIISTDIGKSWVKNFASPLGIKTIEKDFKDFPIDGLYAWRTIRFHDKVMDWFFLDNKYNWEE